MTVSSTGSQNPEKSTCRLIKIRNMAAVSSWLKKQGTIQLVISTQFKKPVSLIVWWCIDTYALLGKPHRC